MPSGISVHPSTTAGCAACGQAAHHPGERRIGVGDTIGLHQRDRRVDQPVHLIPARHDAVPAECIRVDPGTAASPASPGFPSRRSSRCRCPCGATRLPRHRRCAGSARAPQSHISSYQPCAVLHGMAIAPQPARRSPSMPRSSQGSGSAPPPSLPTVRSGTRGSDHSTAGMWSWSRVGGRQQRQPHHEVRAGQRAHAAEHAQYSFVRHVHGAAFGHILRRAQAGHLRTRNEGDRPAGPSRCPRTVPRKHAGRLCGGAGDRRRYGRARCRR